MKRLVKRWRACRPVAPRWLSSMPTFGADLSLNYNLLRCREGSIRPGDRLLVVDGTNLQLADLSTAHSALRGHGKVHGKVNGLVSGHHGSGAAGPHRDSAVAVLTIEYSVCVVGAQGPLLVELARPPAHQLGLTLRTDRSGGRAAVIVDDIKAASVADR